MADVITRLKVESSEYDAKIKRAARGLVDLEASLKAAGKSFEDADKEQIAFVKQLGNMVTENKTAKSSVNELTSAFYDLSTQYKKMTDAEKRSEYGKALASSLETLKARILEGKNNLAEINNEIKTTGNESKSTGGLLDQLTGKFGISTKTLGVWGAALGAGTAALEVAKDAFMSSETTADEWGRTMQSAEAIYDSFLQSLNNSDFSGFISRMNEVIQKAYDAYDAMDELETRGGIVSVERTKLQARQTELKATIRREGKDSEAGKAALQELLKLEPKLTQSFRTEARLNYNAFKTAVDSKLSNAGIKLDKSSYDFLMRSFSDDRTYQLMQKNARGEITTKYTYSGDAVSGEKIDTRNMNRKLLDLFTDEWRNKYSPYLNAMYSARGAAASSMLGDARYIKGTGGSGGGGGTKLTLPQQAQAKYEQAMKDYTQAIEQAAIDVESGRLDSVGEKKRELDAERTLWKAIGDAREVYDSPQLKDAQDKVAEKVKELGGSVSALEEEQKKAQETAREMAAAQKRVADAMEEASNAYKSNNLKGYITAMGKVGGDVQPGIQSGNFSLTTNNISAFIAQLKTQLGNADVGTELYNNLQKQLADATTLGNIISEAMKRGIDMSQFNPQEFWKKMTGSDPGDYISDDTWKSLIDSANEYCKNNPIKINLATGETESGGKESKGDEDSLKESLAYFQNFNSGIGQLTNGIQQLGIKLPEGMQRALSVMNGLASIISGVSTLMNLFNVSETASRSANTAALTTLTGALIANTAALEMNSATGIIPFFAAGGVVPHAAGGYYVGGNSYSGDTTPILANAGELILNKASQASLAAMLTSEDGGGGAGGTQPYVSGEQIYIGLTNFLRRSGRGELITSRG